LGRPGDIGGLTSYAQSFGPEIDLAERRAFIEGAVGAGELSREAADELLAGLTSDDKTIERAVDDVNYPYLDDPDADPGKKQITVLDEEGNIVSGPPDKVIPGIPKFARQEFTPLAFAPLRRGIAQLRPAMSMPGLTSGQAAFGGPTEQDRAKALLDRTYRTVLNRNPTQVGYDFYLPKILSGELSENNIIPTIIGGATSGPDKEVAANYALQNPNVVIPTPTPQPFTLQTGAYGAPTPTFLAFYLKKPDRRSKPTYVRSTS
jgi:hypothetical protein